MTIITTCVNYSDYLSLVLPEAAQYGRVIVATCPDDKRTIAIAAEHDVECFKTRAWAQNGSPFNKGAGINAALEYAKPAGWLLLLDADIVMTPPPPHFCRLGMLDKSCLFGVRRRNCLTEAAWNECLQKKSWYDLPLDKLPPVRKKKVWGRRPTANPVGLQGYFQMWHYPSAPHKMFEYKSAAKYDVELALKFADDKRMLLPWHDYAVIHLGQARKNWYGRKTERWDVAPIPAGALVRASEEHYD